MNKRILNRVCSYQQDPEKLLSCCKKFTLERIRNIRWRNRIYFLDNRIKIINCIDPYYNYNRKNLFLKVLWLKDGKHHRDDVDPKTGMTLYSKIWGDGTKFWYKDGKHHRDDIDPNTGLTLPAQIWNGEYKKWFNDGCKKWFKDGKQHRNDIDPYTGIILPAEIWNNGSKQWFKDGKYNSGGIDVDSGITLPSAFFDDGLEIYYTNGKHHFDEIDPNSGISLPATIFSDGSKQWRKDEIIFDPNFKKSTKINSFFSKCKNIFLYCIHKK